MPTKAAAAAIVVNRVRREPVASSTTNSSPSTRHSLVALEERRGEPAGIRSQPDLEIVDVPRLGDDMLGDAVE